jgi:protein-S-isoprenylcysteine O-methyltransferase Ste14
LRSDLIGLRSQRIPLKNLPFCEGGALRKFVCSGLTIDSLDDLRLLRYDIRMDSFIVRGIVSNVIFAVVLITCLFLPAGTWNYWQAWVFFVVFELCAQAFGTYFLIHDRSVIERRVKIGPAAEGEPSQKIISTLLLIGFAVTFVFPAFDHRFGWSPVAPTTSLIGNALVALSFVIFFFVLKANSYAASTIQVEEGQPVISSGPYALVRHPMYVGALILIAGTPLALGSWWGVLLIIPFLPILVWRLLDEERFLHKNLPGYTEYTHKVRYRLVPYLW